SPRKSATPPSTPSSESRRRRRNDGRDRPGSRAALARAGAVEVPGFLNPPLDPLQIPFRVDQRRRRAAGGLVLLSQQRQLLQQPPAGEQQHVLGVPPLDPVVVPEAPPQAIDGHVAPLREQPAPVARPLLVDVVPPPLEGGR